MIMFQQAKALSLLFLKGMFWLIVGLNALFIFVKSLSYYTPNFNSGFLSDKKEIFYQTIYPYFFYGHISISSAILVIGLFQFSKIFRAKYLNTHRLLGKLYIGLVLFVSAPSALVMGIYATGNWWIKGGFVIASVLWWWFTYKAYLEIRKKNVQQHQRYMQRSYIISLLAVFLRVYYYLIVVVFDAYTPNTYLFVVYASWLPNWVLFELYVLFKDAKPAIIKAKSPN
ncbi:MAG: DUF2306 domain-containing protein [Bacteroidetes bacterium]|nr:MAG: DUF2306 domain-containing protein [Bacteroidota bacterium]